MTKRGRAGAAAIVTVTAPAGGESFRTVQAARFAEVIRGVSFTPGTR